MRIINTSPNAMEAVLGENETFHRGYAEAAILEAQKDVNIWNLTLILSPEQWGTNRVELTSLGFISAGTVSIDNRQFLRVRKLIRQSPDGDIGGRWEPDVPPSDEELQARALMAARYGRTSERTTETKTHS
jgi:hypothetical protein